jgi:hypothetical protein
MKLGTTGGATMNGLRAAVERVCFRCARCQLRHFAHFLAKTTVTLGRKFGLGAKGLSVLGAVTQADVGFELMAHPHMLRHACGYAIANKRSRLPGDPRWLCHRSITSTAA